MISLNGRRPAIVDLSFKTLMPRAVISVYSEKISNKSVIKAIDFIHYRFNLILYLKKLQMALWRVLDYTSATLRVAVKHPPNNSFKLG